MASGDEAGGTNNSPPKSERQMCLVERRDTKLSPLNMTIATRLPTQSELLQLLRITANIIIMLQRTKRLYLYHYIIAEFNIKLFHK